MPVREKIAGSRKFTVAGEMPVREIRWGICNISVCKIFEIKNR